MQVLRGEQPDRPSHRGVTERVWRAASTSIDNCSRINSCAKNEASRTYRYAAVLRLSTTRSAIWVFFSVIARAIQILGASSLPLNFPARRADSNPARDDGHLLRH